MYNKYAYAKYDHEKMKEVFSFTEGYKDFLTHSKTERLAVKNAVALAEEKGFKDISSFQSLKTGDKVYVTNRKKNIALFVIGKNKMEDGINVLGAHIDSPRIDAKQNPLYESQGFVLLDTHYYGGIKKYQFVARPLAIYGVICKKDCSVVDVSIGDDPSDPIVGISDLLIHLAQEQLQKPASTVIEGENLDVTLGSWPMKGEKEDSFDIKKNLLRILKEKYDIEEEDLISAELEIVPAGETRDYGLDRSMIAGYGHDDRVCAYTSLMAILDNESVPERTSCCILVDKEEIGSVGATGAQSRFFENAIAEVMDKAEGYTELKMRRLLTNTKMLSSDVSSGVDPLFLNVSELKNAAFLNKGLVFNKYTGSRGKSGCNDANPEYFAMIRNIMDQNEVSYQTAELGRVDLGGGGTIAGYLGNLNMDVIDAGVAVLNMHSPMEIVSKVDVYEAYKGYRVFLSEAK